MDDILPGIVVYDDVFFVYSADGTPGKVVGKPWDGMIKKGLEPGLRNEKVYNYECSWLGANKMDENGYILDLKQGTGGIAFFTTDPRTPLAKGKYYTEFQVHINDGQTIICHKDFSVISK